MGKNATWRVTCKHSDISNIKLDNAVVDLQNDDGK